MRFDEETAMPPFPDLHDITPPTAPPLSSTEEIQRYVVLPIFAAVVLLLALVFLWRFWRARHRRLQIPPLPVEPAQATTKALEALRSQGGELTPTEFGREVAGIVRGYLQRAHGLRAAQMTTPELLTDHGNAHGAPALPFVRPFCSVLTRCDALKFAGPNLPAAEQSHLIDATLTALEEARRWTVVAAAPPPPPPLPDANDPVAEPSGQAEALPPPLPANDRGNSVSVST